MRLLPAPAVRLAAAFVLVAGALSAQPQGPLPQPLPLLPADNWWNQDIRSAPVDPRSAALLSFLGPRTGLHPDFGGDAGPVEVYGQIWISVPGTQPLVPVSFVEYPEESDAGTPGRPPGYPIPEAAKTEPRWMEPGQPANQDPGGDRHMLLVDRDRRILYELYHAHWSDARRRWEAGSGAVFPLDANLRRPEGWTSADAAGLAILPGLVRWDEVFGPDPIRHAFRVTVRATDGHVWPASHSAGDTAGAPPMGARLRLKASVDLSGYPPYVRRIFEAMKTYGLIVADNGTDGYVTGGWDPRWDNDVLNPAFASLRFEDFEVVQLGWRGGGGGHDGVPAAPSSLAVTARGRRSLAISWSDVAGEREYHVEMRRGASGAFREIAVVGADVTTFTATGLRPGTRYVFRVRARNAAGFSRWSPFAAAATRR